MSTDRTLVQIRERNFLDVLDLALVVVRRKPWALGAAGLCGVAPFAALNGWLAATWPDEFFGFWPLALAMEAPWATAPLTVVLGGLMFGEPPSAGRVVRTLVRGIPAMVVYQVLFRGLLLLTCVFGVLVPARLAFVNEVILLERSPTTKVLRRCSNLCGDRSSELLFQWLAEVLFWALFVFCFRLAAGKIVEALVGDMSWDLPDLSESAYWRDQFLEWRVQAATWRAEAFFGVVRFLSYIDQRIRLEGWEVELRLKMAGAALEDPDRW
jgi:hypothetical protein